MQLSHYVKHRFFFPIMMNL